MSEKTPRERVEDYLELCNSVPGDYTPPIEFQKDLRAVLKANAHYETLMREAAKEAVREYKQELAESLEALKRGETEDGIDMLDNVIEGLREGSI